MLAAVLRVGLSMNPLYLLGVVALVVLGAAFFSACPPAWLQAFSRVNPLSYEVDGLRGLLVGTASHVAVDLLVLAGCAVAAIAASSALLGRLTR